jgi:hypothetical protein
MLGRIHIDLVKPTLQCDNENEREGTVCAFKNSSCDVSLDQIFITLSLRK